jgi:GGDEF domain-containing protein
VPAATEVNPSVGIDPETRLWNAQFFRDRLTAEVDSSRQRGSPFSIVMIQVADEPFQPLPYRRQVALLRELGHQFVPRFADHLVHLPDGAQHWFAVVMPDTDKSAANGFERRLRSALSGYLRSRGLRVDTLQSATLTSPDDDEAMATVWASLLGADARA